MAAKGGNTDVKRKSIENTEEMSALVNAVAALVSGSPSGEGSPIVQERETRDQQLMKLRLRNSAVQMNEATNPGFRPVKLLAVKHNVSRAKTKKGGRRKGKYPTQGFDTVGSFRSILPDQVDIELPYVYASTLTAAGSTSANKSFTANALYDPDPAVGGTSFVGLAEYAALYAKYRVISFKWKLEVSNKEDQPLSCKQWVSNIGLTGSLGVNSDYYALQPFGHIKHMGPLTGGNESITMSGAVPLAAFFGTEQVETAPQFEGLTVSSNPSQPISLGFAVTGATALTSEGVYYTIMIRARVRLYERILVSV